MERSGMPRREFLVGTGRLVLLVPAGVLAARCGSSSDDDEDLVFTVTSSLDDGHTHALGVRFAHLADPPSPGVQYTTSTNDGHVHSVVLSEAQLTSVAEGVVIIVNASVVDGHDHSFTIQRPG
jgi:hypothetical protein